MDRRMDRRSLLRLAGLAGVAGAAGLSGCGVASRGGVVVDGPGPSAGTGGSRAGSPLLPRGAAPDPESLVTNFLNQAAGDPANTKPALDRWKNYLTDDFRQDPRWGSANGITVVWLKFVERQEVAGAQGAEFKLIYDMVPLGRLDKYGALIPGSESAARQVTFTVTTHRNIHVPDDQIKPPDQTFYIKNIVGAPDGLLLSTTGLATYFDYRTLYFWDRSGHFLVPDGRYAPKEWEEPTREKKLVEWLLAGPSAWLSGAVQILPDGVSMLDQPAKVGPNKLAVNFTGNTADLSLPKLASQLTWTLLPECRDLGGERDASPIIIKIDSVEKKTPDVRYLADNPTAVRVVAAHYQQAFAIDQQRVRRVRNADENDNTPVPLLSDEQNRDVEWAAYGTNRASGVVDKVALVTRDSKGHTALVIGLGQRPKLAAIAKLAGKEMGQPAFVDDDSLFVIADGHLHSVRVTTRDAVQKIKATAFSVAADGRRLAYVQGGRLYLATLTRTDTAYTVGGPRPVPVILSNLNGVAFTAEGWLAISGTYAGQTRVVEITLDGALVGNPHHRSTDFGWLEGEVLTPVVTSLTASLDDPAGFRPSRRIFLTANDRSRDATSQFVTLATEVLGEPAGILPTNAFFL